MPVLENIFNPVKFPHEQKRATGKYGVMIDEALKKSKICFFSGPASCENEFCIILDLPKLSL
jgi:hypothetical protein